MLLFAIPQHPPENQKSSGIAPRKPTGIRDHQNTAENHRQSSKNGPNLPGNRQSYPYQVVEKNPKEIPPDRTLDFTSVLNDPGEICEISIRDHDAGSAFCEIRA